MIQLQNIHKKFKSKVLFDNFNLSVARSDFLCIVGTSGSGKTTLLRFINALEKPDAGIISIDGTIITGKTAQQLTMLRRGIGYVIQGDGLFPHLTIKENISYVAKLIKMPSTIITERIITLLPMLKIEKEWLFRYPNELSGGQRQRVGIARALCANPPLLLMDEPFGALDEITRKALQEEIINIWKTQKITIIFVTHDISEALKVSSKLLVLHKGCIVFEGSTKSVQQGKAKIHNPFVQALFKVK